MYLSFHESVLEDDVFVPGKQVLSFFPKITRDDTYGAVEIVDIKEDNIEFQIRASHTFMQVRWRYITDPPSSFSSFQIKLASLNKVVEFDKIILKLIRTDFALDPVAMIYLNSLPIVNNFISIQDEEDIEEDTARYSCVFIKAVEETRIHGLNLSEPGSVLVSSVFKGNSATPVTNNTEPPEGISFSEQHSSSVVLDPDEFAYFYVKRIMKADADPGCYKYSMNISFSEPGSVSLTVSYLSGLCYNAKTEEEGYSLYGVFSDNPNTLPTIGGDLLAFSKTMPFSYTPEFFEGKKYFKGRVTYSNKHGQESLNKNLDIFYALSHEEEELVEDYDIYFPSSIEIHMQSAGVFFCYFTYLKLPNKTIPDAMGIEFQLKNTEEIKKKALQINKDEEEQEMSLSFDRFSKAGTLQYRFFVIIKGRYIYEDNIYEVPYNFVEEFIEDQANVLGNIANLPK